MRLKPIFYHYALQLTKVNCNKYKFSKLSFAVIRPGESFEKYFLNVGIGLLSDPHIKQSTRNELEFVPYKHIFILKPFT